MKTNIFTFTPLIKLFINVKPFLGQEPTNERIFMRVCDWWRRENQLLVENWVFVDVPHALLQLGYDPLPNWQIN